MSPPQVSAPSYNNGIQQMNGTSAAGQSPDWAVQSSQKPSPWGNAAGGQQYNGPVIRPGSASPPLPSWAVEQRTPPQTSVNSPGPWGNNNAGGANQTGLPTWNGGP
jgi:hypothetical protein